jgi:hypothetical protein
MLDAENVSPIEPAPHAEIDLRSTILKGVEQTHQRLDETEEGRERKIAELQLAVAQRMVDEGRDPEVVNTFMERIEPMATLAASLTLSALGKDVPEQRVELLYDMLQGGLSGIEHLIREVT